MLAHSWSSFLKPPMTLDFLKMRYQTLRLQINKLNMGTLLWLSGWCSWFLLFLLVYSICLHDL